MCAKLVLNTVEKEKKTVMFCFLSVIESGDPDNPFLIYDNKSHGS